MGGHRGNASAWTGMREPRGDPDEPAVEAAALPADRSGAPDPAEAPARPPGSRHPRRTRHPRTRTRTRTRTAIMLGGLAIVIVILGTTVGIVLSRGGEPGSTPTPPPPTGRGVDWPSGANANPPRSLASWQAWTGRPADVAVLFTSRANWTTIASDDWPLKDYPPAAFPGRVSIAQPPFPMDGNEAACARGAYDAHWAEFGRTLVRNGRGTAFVRLGWEFNGDWFWWFPRDTATWKTCFRTVVTAIRSTAPDVVIDWNMTAHRDRMPNGDNVWDAYPGDDVVDVVSIDAYDSYPGSTSQRTFQKQCDADSGACTVADFARAHGKRFAVPEWGVVTRGEGGAGDNPFYVDKMYELFTANRANLAYEAYFSTAEPGNVGSSLESPALNPRAARRYLDLFSSRP